MDTICRVYLLAKLKRGHFCVSGCLMRELVPHLLCANSVSFSETLYFL